MAASTQIKMISILFLSFLSLAALSSAKYKPDWASLDTRPLPDWYDEGKLGIFIHWGVFSVPSFASEWFWEFWKEQKLPGVVNFMKDNYKPDFTYADFAKDFSAEFYNPDEWADLFKASGARYIVFVSKHCEGFTNWPSNYSFNWNSMSVGPKRDIVGELAHAIRSRTKLHFGLYHALLEWFHPLFLQDEANNFTTQNFVNDKTLPELYELVKAYKPDLLWSDACWKAKDEYWRSKEFVAWLYNESPVKDTVVTNDRWGYNVMCEHGGYWTCGDKFNPGHLVKHKWEDCMSIDKHSWGYRRNGHLKDYLTIEELIETLVMAVSCGGNMLMNIGPRHDGIIDVIFQERLRQMGQWLGVNGEAIYSSKPWIYQNDTINPNVWYTKRIAYGYTSVYAIVLKWPVNNTLTLGAPTPSTSTTVVTLLGYNGTFSWKPVGSQGMNITVPPIAENKMPCKWTWVFKLEGLLQLPRNPKHPVYFPDFEMYKPKPFIETYKPRHSTKMPHITMDFD